MKEEANDRVRRLARFSYGTELCDGVKSLDKNRLKATQTYAARRDIMVESGPDACNGLVQHCETSGL